MLSFILSLVNPLKMIGEQLNKAYELKLLAMNDKERIAAEKAISQLEAQRDILIAEQKHWMTRWIRPAFALPIVIYVWKLVVWDTVLGWGVTPHPGQFIEWLVLVVVGAYFIGRPLEKFSSRR